MAGKNDDGPADEETPVKPDILPMAVQASNPAATATPLDAVSRSLRQAYESTLEEDIPDAFMDLLNKLG